jgi:hypothetical protein
MQPIKITDIKEIQNLMIKHVVVHALYFNRVQATPNKLAPLKENPGKIL